MFVSILVRQTERRNRELFRFRSKTEGKRIEPKMVWSIGVVQCVLVGSGYALFILFLAGRGWGCLFVDVLVVFQSEAVINAIYFAWSPSSVFERGVCMFFCVCIGYIINIVGILYCLELCGLRCCG